MLKVSAVPGGAMRLSTFTVLVAEDEEGIRTLYQRLIEGLGCRAVLAEDGEKAYRLYQQENPDLLLTDADMPFLNGIQLINRIRERDRTLPVIMVSGSETYDPAAGGPATGVRPTFDYLSKPVDLDDLINAIRQNLERPAAVAQNPLRSGYRNNRKSQTSSTDS